MAVQNTYIASLDAFKSVGRKPAKYALIGVIKAYQLAISPFLAPRCRFYPSCSAYALEAVQRYGAAKGIGLAFRRVLRCHPFHPGGHDPVP